MADSADRVLTILLQLKADVAGGQQITTELKAVEAQAAQTTAALQVSSRKITDSNRLPAGFDTGTSAQAVALRAQLDAQVAARNALRGIAGQTLALDEKSILTAELSAAVEARKLLQMERQVILEIQLEAAEARIAGNPAMAAKLEREAEIRLRALTIQRATNLSMEQALTNAERLVLAEEALTGAKLTGLNVTRGQATALAQQLATGNISAESISRSVSGIGSYLTIGALAGFTLYQVLSEAADESLRLTQESRKQAIELEKQIGEWRQLANAARDFGDGLKLGEKIEADLATASEKLEEFRNKQLSLFKLLGDQIARQFSFIPGHGPQPFQEGQDKETATQASGLRSSAVEAQAWRETARQAASAWESLKLEPINDAIAKQNALLDQAQVKYAALNSEAHKLAAGNLDDAGTQRLIRLQKELNDAGRDVEVNTKRLRELTATQTKLAAETDKVSAALQKVDLGDLTNPQKLEAFATEIDGIQAKLLDLGVNADSPNDALEKSKTLTEEIREEVLKLITAWAAVLGEINKTNDAQANDARRAAQKQHNDALREQAALERSIREAQSDVKGNPFLSIADRNAQLIPLLQQEAAAHRQAGNAAKAHAAEMEALALTFEGSLQASMIAWVNNFGSAADQTAGVITGTLNAAIQQTAQLLTDAIFRTGDWEKAILSVGETFVQQLITMGIQMVIQQTLGELLKTESTASSVVHAGVVTAAAVPAAVAESGATGGFNWVAAGVAAAAAIALIVGLMAAGGGFAAGGRTGPRRRFATVGEEGEEFVFTHRATENIGVENLYAMMHAAERAPRFGSGGRVNDYEFPGFASPGLSGNTLRSLPNARFTGGTPSPYLSPTSYYGPNYPGVGGNYPRPGDISDAGLALEFGGDEIRGGGQPWTRTGDPTIELGRGHQRPGGGLTIVPGASTGIFGTPGYDISRFGGDLSLSQFYNATATNLGFGNYGFGYGNPAVNAYPNDPYGAAAAGPVWVGTRGGYEIYNPNTGTYVPVPNMGRFGGANDYASAGGLAASAMRLIGHDSVTGAPVYRDAAGRTYVAPSSGPAPTGGAGGHPSDYIGYGQSAGSIASAIIMASQSYGGNPNTMTVGDAGRDLFRSGHGRLDPESGMISVVQAGNIAGQHSVWRDPRWVEPSQAESARLGLSFDARKFNAWLIEHNPWFYNAIPGGADGLRIPGPASRADDQLIWASTGERIIPADKNLAFERHYGMDWDDRFMRVSIPHFAGGGRVSGPSAPSASSSARERSGKQKLNIAIFDDRKDMQRWLQSQQGQSVIVDAVNGARHEIGLPSVE
jgi:hypothetical protein